MEVPEINDGLITIKKIARIPGEMCIRDRDYGFVGDVKQVNGAFLSELIHKGFVPVMAPLTHDGEGHMLNTNADTQ